MRRTWIVLVALALLVLLPLPARADGDPSRDIVRAVEVVMEVAPTGAVHVTETYHWDFRDRNGLGFYRELITAQGWEPDPEKVRLYEYSGFRVASPSGAPADVWVERDWGGVMRLAVGAPDGSSDTRTGLQTYVLEYDAVGLLNAVRGDESVGDRDELHTNIFQDLANPMERVTVSVAGPADVIDVACYQGPFGSTERCATWESDGAVATFTANGLRVGHGLSIAVAWPAGTFTDIAPILVDREDYGGVPAGPSAATVALLRANSLVSANWAWLLLGWLAVLGARAWARVARGRDRYFVDLPPGVLPPDGATARTARLRREPALAVRFTPPDGLLPAEAGVLESERVKDSFLAATLVDLAVRGYLTLAVSVRDEKGAPEDWRLTRVAGADPAALSALERGLLTKLFGRKDQVKLSSLEGKFASRLAAVRAELTTRADEKGFFLTPGLLWGTAPGSTERAAQRRSCLVGLVWLLGLALVIAFLIVAQETGRSLSSLTWAVAVPVVTWPIANLLTAKAAHGRTAHGRALYEQVRGFRQYLATADAHQLRWEEGQDIFSRYLPWAMVFGLTERWAALFADLAAAGRPAPTPTWFVGLDATRPGTFTDVGTSLTRFTTTATATLSSTPGSSGGSGSFSGGGGSSGGGGGGGGSVGGR